MRTLHKKHFRLANCDKCQPTEQIVQNGLALTPLDVKTLSERGIPVNLRNTGIISDPETPTNIVPAHLQRGADLNSMWETSQVTKRNLIQTYRAKQLLK